MTAVIQAFEVYDWVERNYHRFKIINEIPVWVRNDGVTVNIKQNQVMLVEQTSGLTKVLSVEGVHNLFQDPFAGILKEIKA